MEETEDGMILREKYPGEPVALGILGLGHTLLWFRAWAFGITVLGCLPRFIVACCGIAVSERSRTELLESLFGG